MKKALVLTVLALSILHLSGCVTAMVDNIAHDKTEKQTENDKLLAIGQIKSDGRFTVIGDKYLYVINDEMLNQFLSNNMKELKQYYLQNDKINIDMKDETENKGNISFDLIDKNTKEVKSFHSEIELYNKTKSISSQYVLNSTISININLTKTIQKGNKALSAVLKPFAIAADIVIVPTVIVGLGIIYPNPKCC